MKRNSIYKLALSALLVVSLGACDKKLDINPTTTVDASTALETDGDFTSAVVGAYRILAGGALYGTNLNIMAELQASEGYSIWGGTFVSYRQIANKTIVIANADITRTWVEAYQAINIANILLESSSKIADEDLRAEIEGEMGDSHVGLQARLMSQAMRKLSGIINKSDTAAIFINQLREKVGIMFGNPETTTGGNALKFYASMRLDIRGNGTPIKDGEEQIGRPTRVRVVKNKVAPPFRKAEFDIMYGEGISRTGEIIDLGSDLGIIKKSGSWYSYNDTRLGQGRDAAKLAVKDNPELSEELEKLIFEALNENK